MLMFVCHLSPAVKASRTFVLFLKVLFHSVLLLCTEKVNIFPSLSSSSSTFLTWLVVSHNGRVCWRQSTENEPWSQEKRSQEIDSENSLRQHPLWTHEILISSVCFSSRFCSRRVVGKDFSLCGLIYTPFEDLTLWSFCYGCFYFSLALLSIRGE